MVVNILSIISSFLVAFGTLFFGYLSSSKQKKLEEQKIKIEYVYKTKFEIYERLMEDFGTMFNTHNYATEQRFLASLNKAILVSNKNVQDILIKTIDYFKTQQVGTGIDYFKNNLSNIATDLQESKNIIEKVSNKETKKSKQHTNHGN